MKPKISVTANTGYSTETSVSTSSPPPSPRNHHLDPDHIRRRRRPSRSKSFFRRRSSLSFFLLSLLYAFGAFMCIGPFYSVIHGPNPLPGSVYRSHELFQRLFNDIQSENSSAIQLESVWRYKRRDLKEQKPCPNMNIEKTFGSATNRRYLVVEANGGLNQQRSAICNAVAVAALLDAILVIPRLEFHNVWRDPSVFSDVYDERHFIELLDGLVRVVHDLPEDLMAIYDSNISNIPTTRVHAWATAKYYLEEVKPIFDQQQVIRITPFANRLAMKVPPHIQFLRCHANYKALKFSPKISTLAKRLVSQMMEKSLNMGGKYISIHLRFEEDMVAFSCCVYNGGEDEKSVMDSIREKGWGNKFKRKDRFFSPSLNRVDGKCPMTPVEVGMMLRGMGFSNDTPIYLASGKIYQAERYLAPLKEMFPLLQSKESLASTDELASFEGYSSRLAALDYMVCLFSEVFVTTQGGNFPHFLMGHRRFLFNGHAKTIKPDKRKLVLLFQDMNISWNAFKDELGKMLDDSDRKGIMVPPRDRISNRKGSVFSNPLPECRCLWESRNSSTQLDDISSNK